jgi:hypothetical protein
VRNKCTCHVYGQIHQYRIEIETEEIKLDANQAKQNCKNSEVATCREAEDPETQDTSVPT